MTNRLSDPRSTTGVTSTAAMVAVLKASTSNADAYGTEPLLFGLAET